jgi:S-(hydroxymethyl)glutathione dehydrogenase/alcohol dehydrogenase
MRGTILPAIGQPLEVVDDLELAEPRQGEVRVRIHTSGVCHSDLSVQNGTIMVPLPAVLGHEAAGIVEAVGPGVTTVEPGDHVVLSFVPECGRCWFCRRGQPNLCEVATGGIVRGGLYDGQSPFSRQGQRVNQMTQCGTFAEATVVPEGGVIKIDPSIPLEDAALLGCGVTTGVGAVFNTARVEEGSSVAVIGAGGVGLNVIQGAVIAGAAQIIAVDLLDSKLELARSFGATHTVNAGAGDPVAKVRELTGQRGVDYAFEVIGLPKTQEQAYRMARRGGMAIFVGVPKMTEMFQIQAFLPVFEEKTIKGCWYGSARTHVDIPKLLDLYKAGRLKLKELITKEFTLDQINEALEALQKGEVARGVVRISDGS